MGMNTDMLMMNPMPMLLVRPIFLMECKSLVGISQSQGLEIKIGEKLNLLKKWDEEAKEVVSCRKIPKG
jgi:hypothetical protein